MGQTDDMGLSERIDFIEREMRLLERYVENAEDGSIFGPTEDDIQAAIRRLDLYALELDRLEGRLKSPQAKRDAY